VAASSAGFDSVTNGQTPDGQQAKSWDVSVFGKAVRLQDERPVPPEEGDVLRYALLIYDDIEVRDRTPEDERRRITAAVLEVLERPDVIGWLRLRDVESATTLRRERGRSLLTDGPFVDSKDFLGGFVEVEAANIDGALALAEELQELRPWGAIEVRPVREEPGLGA
jgi:hypothetical protein